MSKNAWEYKTVYFGVHELPMYNFEGYLNKEGKNNWELVQVLIERMINAPHEHANYTFIFKRLL